MKTSAFVEFFNSFSSTLKSQALADFIAQVLERRGFVQDKCLFRVSLTDLIKIPVHIQIYSILVWNGIFHHKRFHGFITAGNLLQVKHLNIIGIIEKRRWGQKLTVKQPLYKKTIKN
jgi:hypothetical protein